MKLQLTIDLDNAWYNSESPDGKTEIDLYAVAGTLRDLADRLAREEGTSGRRLALNVRDGNGNTVGKLTIGRSKVTA